MRVPKFTYVVGVTIGFTVLFAAAYFVTGCAVDNGASSSGTGMSKLTVSISDPATCTAAMGGSYSHVYVTITDVTAHASSSASSSSAGWVDLTPGMKPTQVDLLGPQASGGCFLATLGDALEVQAGNYQQIRLILAPNNSTMLTNNVCSSQGNLGAVNCVQLSNGSWDALQLSSEAKTGIKIPASRIQGGSFDLAPGQTSDLNINFVTCESILREGNGRYRLLPVLNAGQVSGTTTSINGTVLDATTGNAVNGKVMVALEQPDSSGVDRVVDSTMTNTDGTFVFCPIPAGTYDVVVDGVSAAGVAYQPSIVTGVKNGETTGTIKLYASTGGSNGAMTLNGLTTSTTGVTAGSPSATEADIQLSVLEKDSVNTGNIYTIPLFPTATNQAATLAVATTAGPYTDPTTGTSTACPANTDCAPYSVTVPAGGLYVSAWSSSGSTLTAQAQFATYVVDGLATVPESGGTPDCVKPELQTSAQVLTAATTSPLTLQASDYLNFLGCQQYP